jgi:hypothetical protein
MNPLFERFQQKRQQAQQNVNPFSSPEAFQQASGQMMDNLNKMGMTPEARVRQLMQSGQMTQEQFGQLSQQADQIYQMLYGRRH